MSRINTNVSSLIAQKTLTRSNAQLQETLTRLSTGLRINAGKDDPAGLIASENLRRDITSASKAISNSERASQLIATADSALGQISGLLNDIRGLVVEAANTGVLSDEQIAANQLQVDSSLEAIDRIAQVTTFQGRKLLDGSLDFQISYASGGSVVRDLSIDQANLGALGAVDVDITITTGATQALVTNTGFNPSTGTFASGTVALANSTAAINISATGGAASGVAGNSTDVVFQAAADIAQSTGNVALTATAGNINITAVAGGAADGVAGDATDIIFQAAGDIAQATGQFTLTGGSINLTAVAGGAADGAEGDNLIIDISSGPGATAASYNAGTNTLTINVDDGGSGDTLQDIADAIDADGTFASSGIVGGGSTYAPADDGTYNNVISGGDDGTLSATYTGTTITVNAAVGSTVTQISNAINGLAAFNASVGGGGANAIDFTDLGNYANELSGGSDGTTAAVYGSNTITASVALNATITNVVAAIDGLAEFSATPSSGAGNAFDVLDFGTVLNPLAGGTDSGTNDVLTADLVVKIAGATGGEVFTFEAGTTITQLVNAVNLVSDAIGVEAADNGGTLELRSVGYGSNAIVDVEVLDEGALGDFETGLSATRATGVDVVANVNGVSANGNGNTLSINTTTLDLSLTVANGSATDISFTINGGGAVFQLGPQVVSNQQARIGIGSVNTGELGGVDGRLYQLRSGNDADMSTSPRTASLIVDSAINKVTGLRGRLGAFERTTLQTNIASLSDTISNLTEAESSIRDADFAAETARLTRAQILVQSGTAVLQIANQNPQNVLALLRG